MEPSPYQQTSSPSSLYLNEFRTTAKPVAKKKTLKLCLLHKLDLQLTWKILIHQRVNAPPHSHHTHWVAVIHVLQFLSHRQSTRNLNEHRRTLQLSISTNIVIVFKPISKPTETCEYHIKAYLIHEMIHLPVNMPMVRKIWWEKGFKKNSLPPLIVINAKVHLQKYIE